MILPEKVSNFMVYGGTRSELQLGTTDCELPAFEAMKEKITGAGISGAWDSPNLGQFDSQQFKMKVRVPTEQTFKIPVGPYQIFVLYGAAQVFDTSSGGFVTKQLKFECRGPVSKNNPGKVEAGKPMECEIEVEVLVWRVSVDGVEYVELDKPSFKYVVNGVDYLASVRLAMGV